MCKRNWLIFFFLNVSHYFIDDGNSAIFIKSVIDCIRIKLFDEKNSDFFFRAGSRFSRAIFLVKTVKSRFTLRAVFLVKSRRAVLDTLSM